MAVACIGVGDGGHCLNPQPDLPCNRSTGTDGPSSGGATASSGSGPIIAVPGSGGALDVGSGGASGVTPGESTGDAGEGAEAAAGDSSVAAGAGGEAGSAAGSGGAGGSEVVH